MDTPINLAHLRAGKGRRLTFGITPSYPNRKTSNYGLVGEAITQDRIQGVQYTYQKDVLDAGISAYSAYRLGTRAIGDISGDTPRAAAHTVPHLSFRDLPGELSREVEVAARVGGKWANGAKAGVSYSFESLDARDLTNLTSSSATNTLTPSATPSLLPAGTTDDDKTVLGLDASYKSPTGLVAQGEWYDASVSSLDFSAWEVLVGLEPAKGWRYYARYSQQDMDTAATTNPLTWDTQQVTLSLVQPLKKSLWLQYEYEINSEDPPAGVSKVKNNLFFVELFTGF